MPCLLTSLPHPCSLQVQVTPLSLLLSTKDKKTAVRLRPGGLLSRTEEEAEDDDFRPASSRGRRSSASSSARTSDGGAPARAAADTADSGGQRQQQQRGEDGEPVLAEPQTFYRLADGSWHFELCRFYTAAQAEAAAAAAGRTLVLPQGFDRSCELLKAVEREHAPMSDIAGGCGTPSVGWQQQAVWLSVPCWGAAWHATCMLAGRHLGGSDARLALVVPLAPPSTSPAPSQAACKSGA